MILSHKHKFIFLKTVKTGGTSTELALSPVCGPDDILAPLGKVEEKKRRDSPARNYARGLSRLGVYVPGEIRGRFPQISGFYNHMPARQVRALVGEPTWASHYKFTIERNPWDRQVSYYFWRTRHRDPQPDFKTWVTSKLERLWKGARLHNWSIYTIGDAIAVDHVIRYERLEEELSAVCAQLGIAEPVQLPSAKGTSRSDGRPYRDFYDADTRDLIASWYRNEIEAFGWEF
jgi:hypothetical protein